MISENIRVNPDLKKLHTIDQRLISALSHLGTQPQARVHLHGHRQPQDYSLGLHPDFIGLNLLQIARLLHQVLVDLLTVFARFFLNSLHRAFIPVKGLNYRLGRTPIRQQRDHNGHVCVGLVRSIERCALRFCKGTVAYIAFVTPFLLAVNTDIAFADLPSCQTRLIGAKYFLRVHWSLVCVFHTQIVPMFPFFSTHHG